MTQFLFVSSTSSTSSSSGCLWAPGRAWPSSPCTSVSCTVRRAPSAAWPEIPTAPGTDTPAAPTCPLCAGIVNYYKEPHAVFWKSLTTSFFSPPDNKHVDLILLNQVETKMVYSLKRGPSYISITSVRSFWLKFKYFFHLNNTFHEMRSCQCFLGNFSSVPPSSP